MSQPRRVKDGDIERPIELFEPWYYGETRPTITTAPEQVMVGESFQFTCASAGEIRRVAMLRAGSVTHGFDFDQRYVALRIERIAGDTITVSAPPTPDIIPPRLYQLIAVNARGSFSTSADRAAVGAVAAVSTALGVSAVYAVNTGRHVCGTFCDPRTTPPGEMPKWKPWFEWQENVFSNYNAVTALSTKVNGTSLFTTGFDGRVWSKYYDPPVGWSAWFPIQSNHFLSSNRVTAISTVPGGTSLFVSGEDGRIWTAAYDPPPEGHGPNEWGIWRPVLDNMFPNTATVAALCTKRGGANLFVVGFDGHIWTTYFDPDGEQRWVDWGILPGRKFPIDARIAAVSTTAEGAPTSI